jgi:hypothetical protein
LAWGWDDGGLTKVKFWAVPLMLVLVLLFVYGCASAPTAWEQKCFDTQTNNVLRPVMVTNVVPSTVTNTVVVMQAIRLVHS